LDSPARFAEVMTHDPLCRAYKNEAWWISHNFCDCTLIAQVRDDEREEAWMLGYNTGFKYGLEEANITMKEYQERSRNMYRLGKALEELANSNEDT
jgi:hypothetical protein